MSMGPEEARFHTSLDGADHAAVARDGAEEWHRCSRLLARVAASMHQAAANDAKINGKTGPALGKAFRTTSAAMHEKSQILMKGSNALNDAAVVLQRAQQARTQMNAQYPAVADPGPKKTTTQADIDNGTAPDNAKHNAKVDAYQTTVQHREHVSRTWADHIDTVFASSTATMQGIHGTDPAPTSQGGGGQTAPPTADTPVCNHPGSPGDAGTSNGPWGRGPTLSGPHPPHPPQGSPQGPPGYAGPGGPDGPGGPGTTGAPGGPGAPGSTGPQPPAQQPVVPGRPTPIPVGADPGATGVSPGVVGGLLGGGVIGTGSLVAGIRSGTFSVPGLSARGVAPIGGTPGSTTEGVLGRSSGAVGEEGATGGATGGRAGGVGGARGGSAGSRGGRGAGSGGAGGRGGKDKKRGQHDRDLFDDGQDWLDDEGVAPSVLD